MSNADLTFAAFSAINRERCEKDFHRTLDDTNDHTVETWALKLVREAGEVAEAVLNLGNKQARKGPATAADVGDELADVVSYCDLLASRLGLSLGDVLASKWNRVSERVGSALRIETEPADPSMPPPDVIEAMANAEEERECSHGLASGENCIDCRHDAGEDDFDRNACPGCGGGCQVACR